MEEEAKGASPHWAGPPGAALALIWTCPPRKFSQGAGPGGASYHSPEPFFCDSSSSVFPWRAFGLFQCPELRHLCHFWLCDFLGDPCLLEDNNKDTPVTRTKCDSAWRLRPPPTAKWANSSEHIVEIRQSAVHFRALLQTLMIPGLQNVCHRKLLKVRSATNKVVHTTSHYLIITVYHRDDQQGHTNPGKMGVLGKAGPT